MDGVNEKSSGFSIICHLRTAVNMEELVVCPSVRLALGTVFLLCREIPRITIQKRFLGEDLGSSDSTYVLYLKERKERSYAIVVQPVPMRL